MASGTSREVPAVAMEITQRLKAQMFGVGADKNSVDPALFLAEAKVGEAEVASARRYFDGFCTEDPQIAKEPFMDFEGFHRLNLQCSICTASEEEHFFRAMDGQKRYWLDFSDFLRGCAAATPSTPHILNSCTGFVRARYIFDYYNASRSDTLDYEEFARLLGDSRRHMGEAQDVREAYVLEAVRDLGEVSAVMLRVKRVAGIALEIRASSHWTGLRVMREIARLVGVPAEEQQLYLGDKAFEEDACLKSLLPEGAPSADILLVRCDQGRPACPDVPESVPSGVERLAHVSFKEFYRALVSERYRGTSRLFRLQRSLLQRRTRPSRGSSAASNASAAAKVASVGAPRQAVRGALGGA